VGLIARAEEAQGIATVSLTSCRDITEKVKPPRACFLDYPLGNNAGIPKDAANQRAILRAVLQSLPAFSQPGQIIDLPFRWPEVAWEQEVVRTYEEEAHIVLDQRTRGEFDAAGQHLTKVLAEEAATFCQDCAI
jgi:hypothetical protein